jgi:hypothetical protein
MQQEPGPLRQRKVATLQWLRGIEPVVDAIYSDLVELLRDYVVMDADSDGRSAIQELLKWAWKFVLYGEVPSDMYFLYIVLVDWAPGNHLSRARLHAEVLRLFADASEKHAELVDEIRLKRFGRECLPYRMLHDLMVCEGFIADD